MQNNALLTFSHTNHILIGIMGLDIAKAIHQHPLTVIMVSELLLLIKYPKVIKKDCNMKHIDKMHTYEICIS